MIYNYRCSSCGIEYEVERSIHAESSAPSCSTCHTEMIRKYETPAITFKGRGFYSSDKD